MGWRDGATCRPELTALTRAASTLPPSKAPPANPTAAARAAAGAAGAAVPASDSNTPALKERPVQARWCATSASARRDGGACGCGKASWVCAGGCGDCPATTTIPPLSALTAAARTWARRLSSTPVEASRAWRAAARSGCSGREWWWWELRWWARAPGRARGVAWTRLWGCSSSSSADEEDVHADSLVSQLQGDMVGRGEREARARCRFFYDAVSYRKNRQTFSNRRPRHARQHRQFLPQLVQ